MLLTYLLLDFVRTSNDERLQKLKANIEDFGYDPDSIILIVEDKSNPGFYFVYDGNTRVRIVKDIDAIVKLPCRIITLPEGKLNIIKIFQNWCTILILLYRAT